MSDCYGDRESILEAGCPRRSQNHQSLLWRVGNRGQRVAGKYGQPDQLADRLVRGVRSRQRAADQPVLPGFRGPLLWRAVEDGSSLIF